MAKWAHGLLLFIVLVLPISALCAPPESPAFSKPPTLIISPGKLGDWDDFKVSSPSVIWDSNLYRLWYVGCRFVGSDYSCAVGEATSPDGLSWKKIPTPVLIPSDPGLGRDLHCVSVVKSAARFVMFYSINADRFSDRPFARIYLATSADGRSWNQEGAILRAIHKGTYSIAHTALFVAGTYHLWYVDAPHPKGQFSLLHTTSADARNWKIQGGTPIQEIKLLSPGPHTAKLGIYLPGGGAFKALFAPNLSSSPHLLTSSNGDDWELGENIQLGTLKDMQPTSSAIMNEGGVTQFFIGMKPENGAEVIAFARAGP